jgi:hypothetical protein
LVSAGHALARGAGESPHDIRDALANLRREASQELCPLGDPVRPDATVEPAAGRCDVEQDSAGIARMRCATHVPLATEGGHDPAGGALVEAELGGEGPERRRPAPKERVQGIALGQGDVVAADLVTLSDEIRSDEV